MRIYRLANSANNKPSLFLFYKFSVVWRDHMKYFSQFMLLALAVAVLLGLQYQYWLGENGRSGHNKLLTQIEEPRLDYHLGAAALQFEPAVYYFQLAHSHPANTDIAVLIALQPLKQVT